MREGRTRKIAMRGSFFINNRSNLQTLKTKRSYHIMTIAGIFYQVFFNCFMFLTDWMQDQKNREKKRSRHTLVKSSLDNASNEFVTLTIRKSFSGCILIIIRPFSSVNLTAFSRMFDRDVLRASLSPKRSWFDDRTVMTRKPLWLMAGLSRLISPFFVERRRRGPWI